MSVLTPNDMKATGGHGDNALKRLELSSKRF